MRLTKLVSSLAFALVIIPACDQQTPRDAGTTVLDKGTAREQAKQDKADGIAFDYCEAFDWYGDGICDDFCLEPDPDCETDGGNDVCGGIVGWGCDEGEFCKMEEGTCHHADDLGTCTEMPEFCTEQFAPVCGCDGQTYGNDCFADAAGVTVDHVGECEDDGGAGDFCGGFAGLTCDEGEFCSFEESATCGFADASGTCKPMPEVCTQEFAPVCGCDGQNYSNACHANGAGTSVLHSGPCDGGGDDGGEEGADCGGFLGLTCADDLYCHYEVSEMCGAADHLGTCAVKPEVCIQIFAPVCGCDGNTYSNDCHAAGAGVSVISSGPC